jgi:hypothetical protein
MPWSAEDDERGRVSDSPERISASAVSSNGNQRPAAGEARNDRTSIVRQPQFGQRSDVHGGPGASEEAGKK